MSMMTTCARAPLRARTRSAARWSSRARRSRSPSRPARRRREYTVTVTCGAGGSVSPSGNQKVAEGGSVSFTITPKDGYEVATLVIDGTTVLPLTSYSFMNVDSNHTLYVTFREK